MLGRKQVGMTLLELMIVVIIVAILAAIAVPSFSDYILTQRAKGAAEGLTAALQNAKAESVKTNSVISIVFKPSATGTAHTSWCYGMTITGSATCDCTASPTTCATGSVVDGDTYKDVTMTFNGSDLRSFEPVRGGANGTQASVLFAAGNNKDLGVRLSTIGRISLCRPTGTKIARYQDSGACP